MLRPDIYRYKYGFVYFAVEGPSYRLGHHLRFIAILGRPTVSDCAIVVDYNTISYCTIVVDCNTISYCTVVVDCNTVTDCIIALDYKTVSDCAIVCGYNTAPADCAAAVILLLVLFR